MATPVVIGIQETFIGSDNTKKTKSVDNANELEGNSSERVNKVIMNVSTRKRHALAMKSSFLS